MWINTSHRRQPGTVYSTCKGKRFLWPRLSSWHWHSKSTLGFVIPHLILSFARKMLRVTVTYARISVAPQVNRIDKSTWTMSVVRELHCNDQSTIKRIVAANRALHFFVGCVNFFFSSPANTAKSQLFAFLSRSESIFSTAFLRMPLRSLECQIFRGF